MSRRGGWLVPITPDYVNFSPECTLREEEAVENDQLKPTLLFFRHHPEALVGDGTLTSSLQSLETSFLLISLSRFPHALTACFTAIETAIRASGVGGKRKINLLSFSNASDRIQAALSAMVPSLQRSW